MLSSVIFDLDGILADTEPVHYRCYQMALSEYGFNYSWQDFLDDLVGFDDRDALRHVFKEKGLPLSEELLTELIQKKAGVYLDMIAEGIKPYPRGRRGRWRRGYGGEWQDIG